MKPRPRATARPVRTARTIRGRADGAPIRFGTSGWRGVLGEEVTFPRLRVLVRSVADWIREERRGERVLVGWDGRFASREMAETSARILLDAGLRPVLARYCTPTPAVTHALARGRHAAGLVLTASHNPPADHGLKVFDATGAAILDRHARRIEAIAASRMRDDASPVATRAPTRRDLAPGYRRSLAQLLDGDALRATSATLVYDAMHGAAAGYLDGVLTDFGVAVESLRATPDPTFGGSAPDPIPERLTALAARMREQTGLAVGIANDGDGDRIGVVDGRGRILSETQVMALLVDHLASRGRLVRGLALGAATGSLVEKVGRAYGLPVERHRIGFKDLSAALLARRADVAAEESGGFAWAPMGPDKDGILAGALLFELVASTGLPLETHLERLESTFGPSACGRIALPRSAALDQAIGRLVRTPPARVGTCRVERIDDRFGLRCELADGGFLMVRPSGTEPLVRLYAEAADPAKLAQRLRDGARMLVRAGR